MEEYSPIGQREPRKYRGVVVVVVVVVFACFVSTTLFITLCAHCRAHMVSAVSAELTPVILLGGQKD